MPLSTMEVCHCGPGSLGHGNMYVPQPYILLSVDHLLHRSGATHVQLHAGSYYYWVWFNIRFWNVRPGPNFGWLQLQRRGGLTGVCIAAVSQLGSHSMKRLSFGLIQNESHLTEGFVKQWVLVVENVRKMITKSGKSWEIRTTLQVTMEWMTVNLHILLKSYPAAYSCKWQVSSMVPWFAVSLPDIVCLFGCRDTLKWMTADISCLVAIKRKLCDGKVVWWYLSEHIAGNLHETHTYHQVMMYG
jgi:hypothetical protein